MVEIVKLQVNKFGNEQKVGGNLLNFEIFVSVFCVFLGTAEKFTQEQYLLEGVQTDIAHVQGLTLKVFKYTCCQKKLSNQKAWDYHMHSTTKWGGSLSIDI